jgi:hypothetical protein
VRPRPLRGVAHAPQRGIGVLAGCQLDHAPPEAADPGLGRAVAAQVDPRAQAARALELRARRDLLDGSELAADERARLALDQRLDGTQALLDGRRRRGCPGEGLVLDLRA